MCTPGGDLSPLELADVNRDGLRDVLLSFVTTRNGTEGGKRYIWRLPRGRCQLKDSFPGTVCSAREALQATGHYRSTLRDVPHQKVPEVNKDQHMKTGPRMVVHLRTFNPSPQKVKAGQFL